MSSNIKVQRICQFCSNEFTAKTTVTQYCSDTCAKRGYKLRLRNKKVEEAVKETARIRAKPIEELNAKEFLTVAEAAALLNFSKRTIYYYVALGRINAVNLSQRLIRIRRAEINKLFEEPKPEIVNQDIKLRPYRLNITNCYNLTEVQKKFGISESALQNIINRNNIPKYKKGWYVYVPKTEIDKILS
jgi:excisionase family DNA binding protein